MSLTLTSFQEKIGEACPEVGDNSRGWDVYSQDLVGQPTNFTPENERKGFNSRIAFAARFYSLAELFVDLGCLKYYERTCDVAPSSLQYAGGLLKGSWITFRIF